VHARLNHPNIVGLIGAGTTSKGVRFVVLERLDGGTLTQMLGYDTRIRDRRRRFWKKKQLSFLDVLRCARSIADAMAYCNRDAIPGCMVLHRDLKPDNIGFTLSGVVKLMDFGLAKILENATPDTDDVYEMSGETGSLRYMSPEVADSLPYNHKADVYSFGMLPWSDAVLYVCESFSFLNDFTFAALGMILWELNTCKKPFDGLSRDEFYERVVHGGERPPLNRKWPVELISLICDCWSEKVEARPTFDEVLKRIDKMLGKEKGAGSQKLKNPLERLSGMIDRHSTWF
jgi:serine/threonine protein kinase